MTASSIIGENKNYLELSKVGHFVTLILMFLSFLSIFSSSFSFLQKGTVLNTNGNK
jgi:hypothetical protein